MFSPMYTRTRLGWLFALAAFAWANFATAEEFSGTVTSVAAGHVITVQHGQQKDLVVLYAIKGSDTSTQVGRSAKSFTSGRVLNKKVRVQVIDRGTRAVYGYVRLNDGKDLAEMLVKNGMAVWTDDRALPDKAQAERTVPPPAFITESLTKEDAASAESRSLVLKGDPAVTEAARQSFRQYQERMARLRESELLPQDELDMIEVEQPATEPTQTETAADNTSETKTGQSDDKNSAAQTPKAQTSEAKTPAAKIPAAKTPEGTQNNAQQEPQVPTETPPQEYFEPDYGFEEGYYGPMAPEEYPPEDIPWNYDPVTDQWYPPADYPIEPEW